MSPELKNWHDMKLGFENVGFGELGATGLLGLDFVFYWP